ncbi:MAG: hypothetical protein LQ344_000444 [Seirophora lacunosa]|nr:MAG: hypothetical protein LQ344_000444 [Seirophora lacunosa]
MHPTQESGFLQQKRRTFDSSGSGRSGRSDSPRSAGSRSSNHRRRSPDWTVRRTHKDSRDRRHSKRDATDQASQAQANPETSQPGTTAAVDFKQEYQGYLEAFDMVRSNATDIVMPIVEEMVEDSDSALVWGMAWEIISLADPSIIVAGGLFYQGMHACDWYEDYMANTTDAEGMEALRDVKYILIDIYHAAQGALEQADLLGPLEKLASALDTNDTSVAGLEADHTTTDRIIEFFDSLPDSNLTAGFEGKVTPLPVNTTSLTMGNSTFPSTENSTSAAGSTTAIPTDTASSLPVGNLTKPVNEAAAGMGNNTEPGNDATASSTILATTSPSEVNAFNHLRLGHGFPKGGHTVGSLGTKFFSAPTPQTSTKAMLSPRLKTIRLPLVAAFENVELLEDLIITASELHRRIFEDPDVMTLRLIPPAPLIPIPPFTNDEDQEYKIGTPAESRKRKRQGLRLGEQSLRGAGSF